MTFDALPATPAFPPDALDVRAELLLSGTWTDITAYVLEDPVTIGRGHPDESTTTTASTCTLTLDNSDARFSATNPTGPYYGSLGRNVPLRISVPEGASYLRLENDGTNPATSYAQTPDSAGLSITGDMDIQLDVTIDNWNSGQILAGKWAETGNERTWLLLLNDIGSLTLVVSGSGSNSASAFSSVALPRAPLLRQCIRATWANASSTATFYTAPAGNLQTATWTQADQVTTSGVTTLFNSTAPVQVGWVSDAAGQTGSTPGFTGKVHAFRLLSGIAGTTEASPDFTAATAGATSFADGQANTWTVEGTSEISNRKYRCHVEVPAWPQNWAPTNTNVKVSLSGAGLLQRIGREQQPLVSAMWRAEDNLPNVAAWWPCEDLQGATQLASALPGGLPMSISNGATPVALAADSTFAGSSPLPQVEQSVWNGPVPFTASWTDNVVRFALFETAGSVPNGTVLASYQTSGTVARVDLVYSTGGALILNGYNGSGSSLFGSGAVGYAIDGIPCRVSMNLKVSGSNITWESEVVRVGDSIGGTSSGTLTSATVGAVKAVKINPNGAALGSTVIGHIIVQTVWDSLFDEEDSHAVDGSFTGALRAWEGETAGNRFQRLCTENGITFRGRGRLATTVAMGAQTSETLTSLLQECVDADHAIWTEPRQCLGWGFRTCADVGNQTPAVSYDYQQDHLDWPLEETEDDQIINNDVTVTNVDGSSARAVQQTGALSVQAPPAGVGTYDTSIALNLFSDSQLGDEAGWNLVFGTVDEPRYPAINIDLGNTSLSGKYYATLDTDLGDRVQITDPPAWLPPNTIDQIVNGSTETLFTKELTVAWAGIPATPWNVAIVGDAVYGRADTDGSALAASVASGVTSLILASASVPWTTAGGDFPFDLAIGGERVTATAAANGASASVTSPGTFAFITSCAIPAGTWTVGWTVQLSGTVGAGDANNFRVYVTDSGGSHGFTSSVNAGSAGTYVQASVVFTVAAGGGTVDIGTQGSTPTTGAIYTGTVTSPQAVTVTRSVNGVVKAQSIGADVRLWTPTIVAMT